MPGKRRLEGSFGRPNQAVGVRCKLRRLGMAAAAGWEAALIKRIGNDVLGRRLLANTSTMLPINSSSDTPVITHKRFAADGQDRVKIRDMSLVGTPDPALRYHSSRGCRPAPLDSTRGRACGRD
jgi:hypothetical protein